jgi:hypothetical protein
MMPIEKEITTSGALLLASVGAQVASSIPDPETVNTVMGLLTQLIVIAIAVWRSIKKPKNNP